MTSGHKVIIAGAGSGGLAAAVCLAQQGIAVTVLEREPHLARDMRAGTYHPPTVEMFDRLGIGDAVRQAGIKVSIWQMRDRLDGVIAEFDLGVLADETPYPYRLHCEQYKLTPILARGLAEFPHAELRYSTSVVDARDRGGHVEVTADGPNGRETLNASYLIGADGARSAVRKSLGVEFEGFTWPERYLVASTPYDLDDELEILSYAIPIICSIGADVRHYFKTAGKDQTENNGTPALAIPQIRRLIS